MVETFLSLIGERLREARKALVLTQDEVAELVGVSREHWGRCERGQAMPGGEVWAALAKAGADVNYVLTGSRSFVPPEQLSSAEASLLRHYRQADEAGQRAIESTAAALGRSAAGRTQVIHSNVGQVAGRDVRYYGAPKAKKAKPTP